MTLTDYALEKVIGLKRTILRLGKADGAYQEAGEGKSGSRSTTCCNGRADKGMGCFILIHRWGSRAGSVGRYGTGNFAI